MGCFVTKEIAIQTIAPLSSAAGYVCRPESPSKSEHNSTETSASSSPGTPTPQDEKASEVIKVEIEDVALQIDADNCECVEPVKIESLDEKQIITQEKQKIVVDIREFTKAPKPFPALNSNLVTLTILQFVEK